MPKKNRLLVVTAVWGDWHVSKHIDLNLPTLLAGGNFPALSKHCDLTYLIYTSRADMERMRRAPAVRALSSFMKLEFRTIATEALQNPIAAHHDVWAQAMAQASNEGSFILLMPPDVAWSDGSFEHIGRLLEAGKKAIFMTYLRADSESFATTLRAYTRSGSAAISVSGAQLVEICLHTLHPLMAAYLRDSSHFPIHREMMLWTVPHEGLLCRMLAREMFVYDPAMMKLNGQNLLESSLDPAHIHVVDDSDDLFAVSLAPFEKESEWYQWPRVADPDEIAEWWLDYDSWVNDLVAGAKLRWHIRPVNEEVWQGRERGADVFLRRAAAMREGRRLFRTARSLACTTGSRLLATAVQSGIISRVARGRGGALVFIPVNNAFAEHPPQLIDHLHDVGGERDLARLMRRHFVPHEHAVEPPTIEARLGSAGVTDLVAADGTPLRVIRRDGQLEVNGVRVVGGPISSGKHHVYLIERLLAPIVLTAGPSTASVEAT